MNYELIDCVFQFHKYCLRFMIKAKDTEELHRNESIFSL